MGITRIREAVWTPLVEHLSGADIVLVSPDGALGTLPLGALPGRESGTYLLEDHTLAVVPVPRLLSDVESPSGAPRPSEETGDLLLVGDVDYDAPGTGPDRQRIDGPFVPLPGTEHEVTAIRELVGKRNVRVEFLGRNEATEGRFRSIAPRYRHLHLATHGFFETSEVDDRPGYSSETRAVRGMLGASPFPGVVGRARSGLALSGANHRGDGTGEDGILTSEEIAALALPGVETVVLSACDTGLGTIRGGEGLLGVQRAFHVAGAQTTVATLWKVDDDATRTLMVEFYRRCWDRGTSRVVALREAQLALLRGYDAEAGEIRGLGTKSVPIRTRAASGRLSPYYWAAFQVSGDWRTPPEPSLPLGPPSP